MSDASGAAPVDVAAGSRTWVLRLPEGDFIRREIVRTGGPYEHGLLQFLEPLVKAGDVVVDVGANVGNHTSFFAAVCGATVEAFEPNPEALEHLRWGLERNGLSDLVRVHELALGESATTGSIAEAAGANLGGAAVEQGAGDIEIVPLDQLGFDSIALMKIDVEGAEPGVLRGGLDTIARTRPYIVAEAQTVEARTRIDEVLFPLGYRRLGRDLSPTDTPTFLYAGSRAALVRAVAGNVPRAARNRWAKLRRMLRA